VHDETSDPGGTAAGDSDSAWADEMMARARSSATGAPLDEPADAAADEAPAEPSAEVPEAPAPDVPDTPPSGPADAQEATTVVPPAGAATTVFDPGPPPPPPTPPGDEPTGDAGGEVALHIPGSFRSSIRGILEWVGVVAGALVVAFIVKTFLFQAYYIPSPSMEPTLHVGDRIIVNKLSYQLHEVNRGDIVVFASPEGETDGISDLIKRVVGLPGETVEVREGRIFIDGDLLLEPYLDEPDITGAFREPPGCVGADDGRNRCTIGDGHVFVMGDNRPNSKDSRYFGPIDTDSITGRAFIRLWPIGDIRRL